MYRYLFTVLLACGFGHQDEPFQHEFKLVGGPCEGCEAIFEFEDHILDSTDTLPDFEKPGPRLKVSGHVYQFGGKTPAPDVILYVYHTNQEGIYPIKGGEKGWEKRHGFLRGWMKTNKMGEYAFYTLKPGPYPDRSNPAHIHLTVLEPSGKYYYMEDFLFAGDPLLTFKRINRPNPRGGDGFVLDPEISNEMMIATRDIELGKNIPGYE